MYYQFLMPRYINITHSTDKFLSWQSISAQENMTIHYCLQVFITRRNHGDFYWGENCNYFTEEQRFQISEFAHRLWMKKYHNLNVYSIINDSISLKSPFTGYKYQNYEYQTMIISLLYVSRSRSHIQKKSASAPKKSAKPPAEREKN